MRPALPLLLEIPKHSEKNTWLQINRGSLNVVVPDDIPEGHSDEEREVDSELEGDEEVGVGLEEEGGAAGQEEEGEETMVIKSWPHFVLG